MGFEPGAVPVTPVKLNWTFSLGWLVPSRHGSQLHVVTVLLLDPVR
jgi:hypothetical protein